VENCVGNGDFLEDNYEYYFDPDLENMDTEENFAYDGTYDEEYYDPEFYDENYTEPNDDTTPMEFDEEYQQFLAKEMKEHQEKQEKERKQVIEINKINEIKQKEKEKEKELEEERKMKHVQELIYTGFELDEALACCFTG